MSLLFLERKHTLVTIYISNLLWHKIKTNLIRTLCHRAHIIFSPDFLKYEISYIKLLLNRNGYPQELMNRTIIIHLKSLKRNKEI